LSEQYFENYSYFKTLSDSDLQALLAAVAEKDKQSKMDGMPSKRS
jgi:hypothetical protein